MSTISPPGPSGTSRADGAAHAWRRDRRLRARRGRAVTGVLVAVAVVAFVVSLSVGSYTVPFGDVVTSVLHLSEDPAVDYVVRDLRLPTALTAVFVGLALGLSGTIFQQLLANPLASPDFVGISSGAALAAVTSIVVFHVGGYGISGAALIGALCSAALIYVLAWRDGISGYRFILIGIGVSEFMLAIVGYVLTRSTLFEARAAMTWLAGSVNQAGAGEIRVLVGTVVVLLPAAVVLHRDLRTLELGDDAARGLGARTERSRLLLMGVAIVLVGVATAAAGPIAFVALVSGPIAHRLLGRGSGGIVAAGCVGAIVTLCAQLIADHLLSLPTGVITGAVGAPYLLYLLITVNRQGRGG